MPILTDDVSFTGSWIKLLESVFGAMKTIWYYACANTRHQYDRQTLKRRGETAAIDSGGLLISFGNPNFNADLLTLLGVKWFKTPNSSWERKLSCALVHPLIQSWSLRWQDSENVQRWKEVVISLGNTSECRKCYKLIEAYVRSRDLYYICYKVAYSSSKDKYHREGTLAINTIRIQAS